MSKKCFASILVLLIVVSCDLSRVVRGKSKRPLIRDGVLWKAPSEIQTRNLFYGPGGRAGVPAGPFSFVEEDRGGGSAKFVVKDVSGARWKVKLGAEARPETAATRLLWAVGYFADTDYYFPAVRVSGMQTLSRGQKYVSPDGTIHGARFERMVKSVDEWSWFDNPFLGTREFNGLRVMMSLMNNWDLKTENNAVYNLDSREKRYVVSDLGATFGRTGGVWNRSKGNPDDYLKSKFVDDITHSKVDLVMHSRPPIPYAIAVPYYVKRTRMENLSEDIPLAHARWIGQWLARLSNSQITDAFRAAGYTPREVGAYAGKVRERISQLNRL